MRNAAVTLVCFFAFGTAMNAQKFSLLPQVGFENSNTKITYNDLRSFSPAGISFSPQASLRLNYAPKSGHGFFVGVASSRSLVSYSFTDPENGMNNFSATTGNMQFQLDGGYLFNSKKISLKGSSQPANKKNCAAGMEKKGGSSYFSKSNCVKSYSSSHCKSGNSEKTKHPVMSKNNSSWVRIQPSIGMGLIPSVNTDVITTTKGGQTTYQYNAGNWNTALMAGTSVEFGKGSTRQFTVSLNYFKGIGNLEQQTISSVSGTKAITTTLQSDVAGWNMKIGIPLSLGTKASILKKRTEKSKAERPSCGQYRIIYKCTKKN